MSETDPSIWLKSKEIIRKTIGNDQAFNIWFGPVAFVSESGEALTLEVPDKFFRDWLLERYSDVLRSGVAKAAGKDLKIEFRLKDSPAEAPQEAALTGQKKEKPFWPFAKERRHTPKEIGLLDKYTFESFVVGPSNQFAHAAALAICDSPAKVYNPLFMHGGVGLGKTHLMHAIGQRAAQKFPKYKVLYITSEEFTNQMISAIQNRTMPKFKEKYRSVDVLLIDDIQFIANKESTQEEFFHTFNALHDAHKQIVVTSDKPPKEIHGLEERLVSRFLYGLVTDIQPPDFETRMAILKKKSEKETIALGDDVFYFLAEKIRSNIRELEGALIRVVAYAKLIGKDVSVDLVKEVLKDMIKETEKKVTVDLIQQKVSEYFDIKLSDMRAKKRSRTIAYPRQVAMYLARQLTDYSLPEIGEHFGGRDHTTVLHACEKIEGDLKTKKGLKELVERLVSGIRE
jgi:chromosomal replication initiator protein